MVPVLTRPPPRPLGTGRRGRKERGMFINVVLFLSNVATFVGLGLLALEVLR
jgi:hypothetical protein